MREKNCPELAASNSKQRELGRGYVQNSKSDRKTDAFLALYIPGCGIFDTLIFWISKVN
jgi:hypothetical protein